MNDEYYVKNGLSYDRITRVLDYFPTPQLVDWKIKVGKREANRVSKVAMNIGTNVDEVIKTGKGKLKTAEAKTCYEAFQQWQKDYGFPTLKEGVTIFNDSLLVAGTPDLLDMDTHTLIDIKCSSEIRDSYWLQTEFYARCTGSDYKAILRLDKNLGMYEYKKMPLSDEHWDACVGAIKLYRYYNKSERDAPQMEEV